MHASDLTPALDGPTNCKEVSRKYVANILQWMTTGNAFSLKKIIRNMRLSVGNGFFVREVITKSPQGQQQ